MEMNIQQYLKNPQGKGSVASSASQWRSVYDPRYEALIEKHGALVVDVHKAMNAKSYFVHVKVPSETHDTVIYDVVLKVEQVGYASSHSIMDWRLRAIANSPSFVFTYENVFKRNKILVEELKVRLPDESYKDKPKVRNPYSIVGYEKTIYYACKFIAENFSQIEKLDRIAHPVNLKKMKEDFSDFNKLMDKIKLEQAKKTQSNKKDREQNKNRPKVRRSDYTPPNQKPVPSSDDDLLVIGDPEKKDNSISKPARQKINMTVSTVDRASNRHKPMKSKTQTVGKAKKSRRI